jgi:D-glycero-beta-D-manno-heptose-7-phosphate kinase
MTDLPLLASFASRFVEKRVLVVGDIMLDETLRGDVKRISPEAPVPVLDVRSRDRRLGGSANAAANIKALGGEATVIGLVGVDAEAGVIADLLRKSGIATHLVRDPSRPTTRKTRLVARGQQMVRVDEESTKPPAADVLSLLKQAITDRMFDVDVCVISDYAKGVATRELCAHVIRLAKARNVPVVVDPKQNDFSVYAGATVLTPNLLELEAAAKRTLSSTDELFSAAKNLLTCLDGASLLATRGADGMTLFENGTAAFHVGAIAKDVFDVTGAGDTVVATLALALAAGMPLRDAVSLASAAASVVVSKEGTSTVSPTELLAALPKLAEKP